MRYKSYKGIEIGRYPERYRCKHCKMKASDLELHIYDGFCKDCFYELGLDKEGKKEVRNDKN